MEGSDDESARILTQRVAEYIDQLRRSRYRRAATTRCWSRSSSSFALDRRSFVQMLGAGVLITVVGSPALAQQQGARRRGAAADFAVGRRPALSARIHFGDDGTITVLSGKVDGGQGARGELAQAAAEELRVPLSQIRMVLGDTGLVPNDGTDGRQRHDAADGAGRAAGGGGRAAAARRAGGREVGRRRPMQVDDRRRARSRTQASESVALVTPSWRRTRTLAKQICRSSRRRMCA